jgi:hypothetical protein
MNKYAKNVKSIPPHYREARKLFLMRLAEANGTTVTTALLAGIGYGVDVAKSSSSRAADKNFSSLCAIARSEEKYRRAWLTKRSRVCPICVKPPRGMDP